MRPVSDVCNSKTERERVQEKAVGGKDNPMLSCDCGGNGVRSMGTVAGTQGHRATMPSMS